MELYHYEIERDVLIIRADGGLDAGTADQFVSALEQLIGAGSCKIIVDCTALHYISSYGLSVLMGLHKRLARQGGDVKLAAINSRLVQLLAITRLDQIFSIYADVNRARLAFRPPSR